MKKTILLTLAALAVFFCAVAPVAATVTPLGCAMEDIPVYVAVLDRWGAAQPLNRGECVGAIRANLQAMGWVQIAMAFLDESGLSERYRLPDYPAKHIAVKEVTAYCLEDKVTPAKVIEKTYTALYIEVEPLLDAKPQATLATIPTQYVSYQPAPYAPPDRLPATGTVNDSFMWMAVAGLGIGCFILMSRKSAR